MTQTLGKYQQSTAARSSPQGLAIHRDSRAIAKIQPKIRIIHIFAPEIIHTDVAHFSETVQRLTGKSSSSTNTTTASAATTTTTSEPSIKKSINVNANPSPRASKLPIKDDHHHQHDRYDHDHGHAHHHGFDHGGFLEALQGVNYNFMQEIGELSFVSMEAGNHQHHPLNGFGETHHSFSYRG